MSVVFVCQDAGRLLYTLPGEWAHVNCSLWSAEVFEEDNGLLQNVTSALSRGRMLVNNCCYRDTCFNYNQLSSMCNVCVDVVLDVQRLR